MRIALAALRSQSLTLALPEFFDMIYQTIERRNKQRKSHMQLAESNVTFEHTPLSAGVMLNSIRWAVHND